MVRNRQASSLPFTRSLRHCLATAHAGRRYDTLPAPLSQSVKAFLENMLTAVSFGFAFAPLDASKRQSRKEVASLSLTRALLVTLSRAPGLLDHLKLPALLLDDIWVSDAIDDHMFKFFTEDFNKNKV
jgi:hypothetical protein